MASITHPTFARVSLLFTRAHSALYRPVSLNVLREVCSFIDFVFLPVLQTKNYCEFILHNLVTHTKHSILLSRQLRNGVVCCMLDEFTLFCAGSEDHLDCAWQVDLHSGVVNNERPMNEGRKWAGIISFDSSVFVFGGTSLDNILDSCEEFSLSARQWTNYPKMLTEKVGFTPVQHNREIYLPAVRVFEQQLEVFTPATLQYRLLPLCLYAGGIGSVSFIANGELFNITYEGKMSAWRVHSQEREGRKIGVILDRYNAWSTGRPMHCGSCVYWPNEKGGLVEFDLHRNLLSEYK